MFRLEGQRYALPLGSVERIVRAAEITPLPGAPAVVIGVISVEGRILPVVDARSRLGLPARDIDPDDHFVIARVGMKTVVLVIDEPEAVIEVGAGDVTAGPEIVGGLQHVRGVVRLDDGLALIHDLENFLSLEETRALDDAIGVAERS